MFMLLLVFQLYRFYGTDFLTDLPSLADFAIMRNLNQVLNSAWEKDFV